MLAGAAVEVAKLQKTLQDSQPELERTQKQVAETKIVITRENEDAQEVKKAAAEDSLQVATMFRRASMRRRRTAHAATVY